VRAFTCPDCFSLVPFESTHCLVSDSDLGYSRADRAMRVLHDGRTAGGLVRCNNSDIAACNWLTTPDEPLCDCCRLTRTRPADGDTAALPMFARTEAAKRRLLYPLDDLGLPVVGRDGKDGDSEGGLAFDLLSSAHENVVIGHASGVVTIDLAEGDDGYREQLRIRLAEPYRTMLGHLRHETGHWYWEVLVDRPGNTDAFRALFGDERVSYADALEQHYGGEPPAGWEERYVSTYATAHPWEDWAESFAHYLHIRDTEQTAAAYGLVVEGPDDAAAPPAAPLDAVPSEQPSTFEEIVETWLPLTYALNAVNRSMGANDLYPFVLAPTVLEKLRFVHDLVSASHGHPRACGATSSIARRRAPRRPPCRSRPRRRSGSASRPRPCPCPRHRPPGRRSPRRAPSYRSPAARTRRPAAGRTPGSATWRHRCARWGTRRCRRGRWSGRRRASRTW
jgi:hypothetical protein